MSNSSYADETLFYIFVSSSDLGSINNLVGSINGMQYELTVVQNIFLKIYIDPVKLVNTLISVQFFLVLPIVGLKPKTEQ